MKTLMQSQFDEYTSVVFLFFVKHADNLLFKASENGPQPHNYFLF